MRTGRPHLIATWECSGSAESGRKWKRVQTFSSFGRASGKLIRKMEDTFGIRKSRTNFVPVLWHPCMDLRNFELHNVRKHKFLSIERCMLKQHEQHRTTSTSFAQQCMTRVFVCSYRHETSPHSTRSLLSPTSERSWEPPMNSSACFHPFFFHPLHENSSGSLLLSHAVSPREH